MHPVKCFLVEPNGMHRAVARRYASTRRQGTEDCAASPFRCHNAILLLGDFTHHDCPTMEDVVQWPTKCDYCDYVFVEEDERVLSASPIYQDEKGAQYVLSDNVPGMMWYATWMEGNPSFCGPDGKSLNVVCPDGSSWCIDSRANNCTMPNDTAHKCWIRHGTPPLVTVDKNGHTCAAGAGSIAVKGYHGFLRNGEFT